MADNANETRDLAAVGAAPVRTGIHANTVLVVLFLSLAGLSFAILQSLVAPALPVIARDLHSSESGISWVLTAYLLAAAVTTPIFGRLGDIAGKRRMLFVVLIVAAIGTVVAALSTTLTVLIIARAIQGVGGAILPLSIGIVRDELPHHRVGVTIGFLSAILGIGAGLGIVLAGPIVDHLSWEWLFWIPLMVILVALIGIAVGVPESPVRAPARLDLRGALILSVSLVCLLLGISQGPEWGWTSAAVIGLFVVAAVTLVVFVVVELRMRDPLIDLRLMRHRGVWAAHLAALAYGFAAFGLFLLIPMLLELPAITGYGFGKTATGAGLFLVPAAAMMLVFGPLSGLLSQRFGPRIPLLGGAALLTIAFATSAVNHGSAGLLLATVFINGAGVGLAFAAMSNAIVEAVPIHHTAEATSVNAIIRTIGSSIGVAVVAAVVAANSTPQGLPTDQAFTSAFWVCTGVGVLAIIASLAVPSKRRLHDEAIATGVEDVDPGEDVAKDLEPQPAEAQ